MLRGDEHLQIHYFFAKDIQQDLLRNLVRESLVLVFGLETVTDSTRELLFGPWGNNPGTEARAGYLNENGNLLSLEEHLALLTHPPISDL